MVDFLCFANLRTGKKNQTTIKSVANGTPCNHRKTMPVYTKEFIRKKSNPRRHAQLVKIFRGVCEFRRSTKKKDVRCMGSCIAHLESGSHVAAHYKAFCCYKRRQRVSREWRNKVNSIGRNAWNERKNKIENDGGKTVFGRGDLSTTERQTEATLHQNTNLVLITENRSDRLHEVHYGREMIPFKTKIVSRG
jgi:hypothetical protein